jgi:hypothetical protein
MMRARRSRSAGQFSGSTEEQSRFMRLMHKVRLVTRGMTRVAERVERYRLNAEKCLQLAQNFQDPEAKRALLVMANAWLMLAVHRSKNIEYAPATSDPPSPVNEPPLR